MLKPGMYLQERYEIIEQVGSGGMADVYKARCHTLNRLVAVKMLKEEFSRDENFVNRFKMEAQAAAGLSHPNIVNVYDVVDEGDSHYIIMELIEGITLKSYIDKKGHLEGKEAIGIAIQMAQGMSAAHQQKIIHQDIKPQNIIISMDGKVKVADFGIARAVSSKSKEDHAIGSVHYVSPEQARGDFVDARSDIYSLGITMFEMVTGRLPFDGESTVAVAIAHLEHPMTPPKACNPDIPESLEQIILKCTEKRPEDRYDTAEAVIADLRRALINPNDGIAELDSRRNTERIEERDNRRNTERIEERDNRRNTERLEETDDRRNTERIKEEEERQGRLEKENQDRRLRKENQDSHTSHGEDISRQIERIFAAAGVVAAILIIIVLLFVFLRLGGLLRSGGSEEKPTVATEETVVPEVTTAAIAEGQVYMPDVRGMTKEDAQKVLEDLELRMTVTSIENSDTYDVGCIMAQEYPEGTILEKNLVVSVKVSKGTGAIDLTVLGLEGMEGQAAQLLLTGKNLVVVLQEENNDVVPPGYVIRYDPMVLRDGETVTLTVSLGPAMVQVPDIEGKPKEEAEKELLALGLVPEAAGEVHSDVVEEGAVVSQSIPAGTMTLPATKVIYSVSLGPEKENEKDKPEEVIIGTTRYIGSIDKQHNLSVDLGPGYSTTSITVAIRLRQEVNGREIIRNLMEPRTVMGDTLIPISFPRIEGADGVEVGYVELVDMDRNKVLVSYPVSFFKTEE